MKYTHISLQDFLDEPVDLPDLLNSIDFDDEEILNAAKAQSHLYLDASRLHVQKMRTRIARETKLKELTAVHSLRIREKLSDGAGRVTEGHVTAKLDRLPKIKVAKARLERAKLQEEIAKVFKDVFQMRKEMLKVIANLMGAEVYIARQGQGHEELQKYKRKLEKKYKQGEID